MAHVVRRCVGGHAVASVLGSLLSLIAAAGCSDSDIPHTGADAAGGAGGSGSGRDDAGNLIPWQGVAMPGTLCRDGSTTGYGLSVNPASKKLLIFMEPGGACFNMLSCVQNADSWAPTDVNVTATATHTWILNRASDNNPVRDWNLAFIPYCSGDVHTGTSLTGYMGQPQTGFLNYKLDLADLISKIPNVEQVVLAGSSAGGFGVLWNWGPTQEAFGSVPVSALNDSGPPMGPSVLTECQQQRVGTLWGWPQSVPALCPTCDAATGKIVKPLMEASLKKNSSTRFGLLSYDEDGTIKNFFGYGYNDCAGWDTTDLPTLPTGKYADGLADVRQTWTPYPRAAMYVVTGVNHTFLGSDIASYRTPTGIPMLDWVKKFVDKSDGWTNVVP